MIFYFHHSKCLNCTKEWQIFFERYYTGWDHSLKICKFEKDNSILKLKLFTLTD
jgi:hypothetical protein